MAGVFVPSAPPAEAGASDPGPNATTKRAPPPGARSTVTVPSWALATAATIARPRPNEPPRSPAPADEPLEQAGRQVGRNPRAVVGHRQHAAAVRRAAASRRSTCVPGGVWRRAFSIRLSATRRTSSRAPMIGAETRVDLELVAAAERSELARGLDDDVGEVERPVDPLAARRRPGRAGAGPRRGGASAATSAAPTGPPHPRLRAASRSAARGSRARWSGACAARATRRRRTHAGARASPRSPPRASAEGVEHPLERPARARPPRPRTGTPGCSDSGRASARPRGPRPSARRSAPSPAGRSTTPRRRPGRRRRARRRAGTAGPGRPSCRGRRSAARTGSRRRPGRHGCWGAVDQRDVKRRDEVRPRRADRPVGVRRCREAERAARSSSRDHAAGRADR